MLTPEALPACIASQLAELGFDPEIKDHGDHVCIETEVSDPTSAQVWRALLALLETADRYGLVTSAKCGQIAWAAVIKNAPTAGDGIAAGGLCHQLYGS